MFISFCQRFATRHPRHSPTASDLGGPSLPSAHPQQSQSHQQCIEFGGYVGYDNIGEAAVGKSSLVLRFTSGDFDENTSPTIGAAFLTQSEFGNAMCTEMKSVIDESRVPIGEQDCQV